MYALHVPAPHSLPATRHAGDGFLDLIVGNADFQSGENQLYINSGSRSPLFLPVAKLPGGSRQTLSLALGDVNGERARCKSRPD